MNSELREMRTVILILLATVGGVGPTSVTKADDNTAIVFGFKDYQHLPDLPKQSDELRSVVDVLNEQCGFSKILAVTDEPESLQRSGVNPTAHIQFSESVERAIRDCGSRLLIYISGHVLENQAGELYLAVPETDPTQQAPAGIQLAEISRLLQAAPKETSILLFLDSGRPGADGKPAGIAGAKVLNALQDIGNLVSFAACSEGQQSYANPETQRSLFSDSVGLAISGAADHDENQIITAKELFRFLFISIQTNAATIGVEQTPVIQTAGTVQTDIEILPFVKQSPKKTIRLVNRESGGTAIAYIRGKNIGQLKLGPSETKTLEVESITDIEFYTGTPNVGDKGWRKLVPAPGDTIDFRMARQMNQGQVWTTGFTNSLGMQLTLVYPGSFRMGRNEGDDFMFRVSGTTEESYTFGLKAELPSHTVQLTSPVYIGSHEVTVDQFRSFVQRAAYRSDAEKQGYQNQAYIDGTGNPTKTSGLSWHRPGFDQSGSHPVVHVTWNDADRFCRWLSLQEQTNYSLPTEAQWEYAARAGTQTAYWNSNDPERLTEIANVRDATAAARFPKWTNTSRSSDGFVFTAPVGQFRANPFGLHDVHGNVWEWCADRYDEAYYRSSLAVNPTGPDAGDERVYRGGCFY